ncbi:MAG: Trm112 family protein [Armatimonadota bacterium]
MVDERLLEILVCPQCKQDVRLEDDWLVCDECRLKYPVRNGIPIMLIDQAEPLEEREDEE